MKNKLLHNLWCRNYVPLLLGLLFFFNPALAFNNNKFLLGVSVKTHNTSSVFQAQQQIEGTVTVDNMPMVGVTITVKGTQNTTVSGEDGGYVITALPSDILIFEYIGFKTVEVRVNGRIMINTSLEEEATSLQEVTVNAGYYTVKEKERTGSIAKIKAADIEKQPVTNVLATMQGRMAGVSITQTTGVPGGGFNIQIRGRNSLRAEGNSPLYIIDGMPYPSENMGNALLSGSILPGAGASPLSSINPTDIESVEVLKDADATAIYGSRGANGVVLITTKKGKAGKTVFEVNAYTGTAHVTRTVDLMDTQQYLTMRRKAFANDGVTDYPAYAYDLNGTWDTNRYTDWQKTLIGGTAETRSLEASISGGNSNTQYLLRGTNYHETTVFPGNFSYNKAAVHFNIAHRSPDEKLTMNFSGNYIADKNNQIANDLTSTAALLVPNAPALYNDNGEINWENSTWSNPLRYLGEKYLANTNTLIASGMMGYRIANGLELKTTLGFTDTRLDEFRQTPHTVYDPAFGLTSAASVLMLNAAKQQSWSVEPQLDWQKTFGNGRLSALIGMTFQESNATQLGLIAGGFASNVQIANIAAASTISVLNNDESLYRYNALFGRVNYNLNEKYIINLTGRRDGSSRFGPGKQFANFGAIGAAWLFSNERAVKRLVPFLTFGKLRSSYGTTGSDQIGNYQFMDTYAQGLNYQGLIGLQPSRLFNPDFSWEVNKKFEAALELGFLKDRIVISAAHFRSRSSNQLVGIPLPGTTGFASIQANLDATVQNTGWEMELRTVNLKRTNLKWTTTANITFTNNELLVFPGIEGSTFANQYIVGQPLDIVKVYQFTGINPETGIYTFEDSNGDGRISFADRTTAVATNPDYYGGVQNSLSVKNWQFDFLFQFVKQIGVNYYNTGITPGTMGNQPAALANDWEPDDTNAAIQLYTSGFNSAAMSAYNRFATSTAAYTDASFIRLKNLSISYTLPTSWSKKATCRIYAQGQNLLTFTNFKGPDPENQSRGKLPPLRVLTLGVQLKL